MLSRSSRNASPGECNWRTFTQRTVHLSQLWEACFSRSIPWETMLNALLKLKGNTAFSSLFFFSPWISHGIFAVYIAHQTLFILIRCRMSLDDHSSCASSVFNHFHILTVLPRSPGQKCCITARLYSHSLISKYKWTLKIKVGLKGMIFPIIFFQDNAQTKVHSEQLNSYVHDPHIRLDSKWH